MKQIRIITGIFTALMIAVLLTGLRAGNSLSFRRRDISEYNDMICRMYEDWRAGGSETKKTVPLFQAR